ncbi:MAG: hypothetical protein M3Z21_01040 [Pseudomonadota bacterium]|nr:hypothetical protein [Pseudomonadota bacterium]
MAEVTYGTLKGRITPKAFRIEDKDIETATQYAEYFDWLDRALFELPESAFKSGKGRHIKRLWAFVPGEGGRARGIAEQALARAQAVARHAGLARIPKALTPPVFLDQVERVDINRSDSYAVRRYDQETLLQLLEETLEALRDPATKWPQEIDPEQVQPELAQLRQHIEAGEFGAAVVTRQPVVDLRVYLYIHGEERPQRRSFNNGLFVEGYKEMPVIQPPPAPSARRLRRTRRDKRTDAPLFMFPTPGGRVAFYADRSPRRLQLPAE